MPLQGALKSGSCRRALVGVPRCLRTLSTFSTFDNMLKLTISLQAKRAEADPRQGTPPRAHLQAPDNAYPHHPDSRIFPGGRNTPGLPEKIPIFSDPAPRKS